MVLSRHVVRMAHGGEVIITKIASNASDADEAIAILMQATSSTRLTRGNRKLVGLDINKVYKRAPSGTMTDKVASLTLCSSGICVVLRLLEFDVIPTSLFALLELPDVYFCSAGMKNCLDSLRREFGPVCRNAINVDFPTHSTCNGCYKGDLNSGVSMALSNWEAADLSDKQISYATFNAFLPWHIASDEFASSSSRYDRCLSNLQ